MPIRLHKFGEAWGIADPSPFCVKLESFLREARIDFEVVPFDPSKSFRRAPKGKLPFIEDEEGRLLADSTQIIERLSRQTGTDLDGPLDDRQRAVSHAFRRMLDEHLYWVAVYSRWCDEPGWSTVRRMFFARLPALTRPIITLLAQRGMKRALYAQGVGRHLREEIYALGLKDVTALSNLLGEDEWFFATHRPTLLDLWSHAFIAEIVVPPIDSPLRQATLALPNLCSHSERLQERLYGPLNSAPVALPSPVALQPPVAKPG